MMTAASAMTVKDFFAAHCSVLVGFSQIFFLILIISNFRQSKYASQLHLAFIANQSQASNLHMTTRSNAAGQSLASNLSLQLLNIPPPKRRSNCHRQIKRQQSSLESSISKKESKTRVINKSGNHQRREIPSFQKRR